MSDEDDKASKRKQSLYFPDTMLAEITEEAKRLDRSLSWVVQRAWKLGRAGIKKLPGSESPVANGEPPQAERPTEDAEKS